MKFIEITVSDFVHEDEYGTCMIGEVKILFDEDETTITPESFDQDNDNYYLAGDEIERINKLVTFARSRG